MPTWGSMCRCRYDGISTFIPCLTLHSLTSLRSVTRSHLVLLQPIVCIPGCVHFFMSFIMLFPFEDTRIKRRLHYKHQFKC